MGKEGAIFSGSGDNSIKKWDIKTGALMATLEGHADEVTCLAISEKEGAIFSGSGDNSIKKWDIKTGALMATLEGHADGSHAWPSPRRRGPSSADPVTRRSRHGNLEEAATYGQSALIVVQFI